MVEEKVKVVEDKASNIRKEWEEYARKGNWAVKGYEIVKSPSAQEKLKKLQKKSLWLLIDQMECFTIIAIDLFQSFFKGLIEGKLYGTKYPKCGTVQLLSTSLLLESYM